MVHLKALARAIQIKWVISYIECYISGSGIWSRRSPGYGGKLGIKVTKYEPQGLSLTCHYSSVICIIPGDVAVRRSEQF